MQEYRRVIKRLFDPKDLEILIPSHAKTVKIENSKGQTLLGVLVDKSIAIPLSASDETDYDLKVMVSTNLTVLGLSPRQKAVEAACNLMGLPFNGNTDGFYSDGNVIGFINTVHIHPENLFASQEDFLSQLTTVFEARGLKITVDESL